MTRLKLLPTLLLTAWFSPSLAAADGGVTASVGHFDTASLTATEAASQLSRQLIEKYTTSRHQGSQDIALILNDNTNPLLWQGVHNQLRNLSAVRHLYAQMNYRALWTQTGRVTPLAAQLISAIKNAWQHGLRPEVYHSTAISALNAGQVVVEPEKFDIVLTDAFITLKKHLSSGIVDPVQQFKTWNQIPVHLDFLQLYLSAVKRGRVEAVLRVNNPDYQALKQAYVAAVTDAQRADDMTSDVKIKAKKLRPGYSGKAVVALRARLGLTVTDDTYDQGVSEAVEIYQRKNGLLADGIAGPRTIKHLNSNNALERAELLAINMERLRWSNVPLTGNYVAVNIPAFNMAIRNGDQFVFESNVIVGRPSRPTPIFSDTMEHVVLSPYWNVPKTIYRKDKLPKLQRNPNALGSSMQVISRKTGKIVSPESVDWASGGTGYRLRQLPGPRNSLGHMKFLFPNQHAIYLHDTPNRKLFKKSRRAYSSGCIRVERAEDLTVFLLEEMGYSRKRIKAESRKKREKWVNLPDEKRYPVFLNYYTAWMADNGEVRYSKDIYGYDKALKPLYRTALSNL